MAVDVSGVCVGFGAACSALAPEPSPALIALGLSSAQARATIQTFFAYGTFRRGPQKRCLSLGGSWEKIVSKMKPELFISSKFRIPYRRGPSGR